MVYNETFMENMTNVLDLFTGVGQAAGSSFMLGNMMLISFALVYMYISIKYDFKEVFIVGGFLSTILAILLFTAGMIAQSTVFFPMILLFIAIVVYFFS